ncbi:uncharacterized protein LOC125275737 [Megalobrama amblycephala]|uniref:uncharacterized protein LOC125275737 n=1 Tax=Megalobrama amblycephala TaxID=75352 RepID=UPI0020146B97|nr:uncharacterized protein LOC125275737 [Megalobrama amblycephala]
MDTQSINFITWNVNGLKEKKDHKFQELQNADVVFLQETHIGEGDGHIIEDLKKEWDVFYTKYTSSSKGTAILVKKRLDFECISDEKDNSGAYVVLKCKLDGQLYTLVSVYNHHTDVKTLEQLSRYLQSMTTGLLVIGGDFNTVFNPFIDKDNSKKVTDRPIHRKLRCCLKKFIKSLQLVDVWRRKNPVNQDYTFHSQVASRLDYFFIPEECMWRVRSCEIKDSKMRDHRPVYLEINNVSTTLFQKVPQIHEWLNQKKDLLTDETGKKSSHEVSEVDIVSAVHSLQVSDTPRPDGIPVSFYKDNIQDLIPYIKTLYDRIHSSAFNCSETHFNETVKSPHDENQHFFNVDYLIIATILARRLDDFLESRSKQKIPKVSASVMITSKTLCTQIHLSCIKKEIEEQKRTNPNLYQDFLIVKNLLRDAADVDNESVDVSDERDKLLDQGCPLTSVLITLALKCFASALAGHLKIKNYIQVFRESVIVCIQPEDVEDVMTAVKSRDDVYDTVVLFRGNFNDEQLKCLENESEAETETNVNNTEEEAEDKCLKMGRGNRECEERDLLSIMNEEEDISMESNGRQIMYAVVTLQDSDEVMVAPSSWVSADKKQCFWPPFKSTEKFMEAVQKKYKPETGGKPWEKLNISFHREHGTFEKAIEGQKEIKEQKERSFLLSTGTLKRQKLENSQPLPPVPPASMSADDKEELLCMLRDIKSTVQENSSMLKKLLNDNTVSEVPSSTSVLTKKFKPNLNLPLRTFDDVDRTERELKNATTRKKYVNRLSKTEGDGPKEVIKNIMQHVLTDDLAKEFNWQGRGEKRPFSQLTLTDVIREAAEKKPGVTRVDCETEIKKYLSYLADRLARKRQREQAGIGSENINVAFSRTDGQPAKVGSTLEPFG